jgi:hypothetical protein
MNDLFRAFWFPITIAALVLAGIFVWLGFSAFLLAALLIVLEITLSFDNAVVNARVLEKMSVRWQQRFLTWGMIVAVGVTRFILPVIIVALSVGVSPLRVALLAFTDAVAYGDLVTGAHVAISSFGGTFLLMVALTYFFDARKDLHWIRIIEKALVRFGKIEAIEIGLTLMVLGGLAAVLPLEAVSILSAGIIGLVLFIFMHGVAHLFTDQAGTKSGGAILFVYLAILDAAFSLDGVVGAFAITNLLPVIVAGLGVGAYFVRTLTLHMVKRQTLDALVYLEHGAHWAILGLSITMLASLFVSVPEFITGGIGIVFIAASYWSSVRARTQKAA